MMEISQNAIELIKQFEGYVLHAYKPVSTEKYFTIGYGHYDKSIKEDQIINQDEAEALLKKDLKKFEDGVNNSLKVEVNQNQFDALVSLAFNIGLSALRKSTLLQLVNKKDFEKAAEEFDKWIHSDDQVLEGLVKRRKAEKELFMTEVEKPKTKPKPATQSYTIKLGDKLELIAKKYKTDVNTIMKLNPTIKNPHLIFTGNKIKLPK